MTVNTPKPMVPIANRPLMSYTIELLSRHGFKDITVLLYHQPQIIKDYFKDGRQYDVKMSYCIPPADYGTAGAVRFACQGIKEPVLVISADLLTDMDLSSAVKFHKKKWAAATVVLARTKNPIPYGIVVLNRDMSVKKFLEKPSWSEVFTDTVNAGIYMLQPDALKLIPNNRKFDFSADLLPLMLEKKKRLFGFVSEGYWTDIGQPDDFGKANHDILRGAVKFTVPGRRIRGNVYVGENVSIAPLAKIDGVGHIGSNSVIEGNVIIMNSTIGDGCKVGRGSVLSECIIREGVVIGQGAKLERTIVGKSCKIGDGAVLEQGSMLGDGTVVEKKARVREYVKIWPGKTVEGGSTVTSSMIHRERWTRSIFGAYGVTGVCNVEITPQFAANLGAAYGAILGKGTRITCSRDSHKSSRMIYRALISGVLSAGVSISDLEMVPIPVNRYELRALKSQGGFHVRKSPYDLKIADIKFFDANGLDLSSAKEKMVEKLFFSENFPVVSSEETGELSFPFYRVAAGYKEGMINYLKKEQIKASGMKVVIDYAFGSASQIFPAILGELGLDVISLNAHIDETKIAKDKAAFERSLEQLRGIVKSVKADIGIMLDTGAEKIFLCDDKGNILDGKKALAAMTILALRSKKGGIIAVPVKEPRIIEKLAKENRGKVMRIKTSFRGMMEAATNSKVTLLGESLGGYIFPDFMPFFDGMLSVCKLIEYLSREQVRLSDLAEEIPEINLLKREVDCDNECKGRVMRELASRVKRPDKVELIDGVKIWRGGDWVLILPDPVRPVVQVFAEADSHKKMDMLLEEYVDKINSIKEG